MAIDINQLTTVTQSFYLNKSAPLDYRHTRISNIEELNNINKEQKIYLGLEIPFIDSSSKMLLCKFISNGNPRQGLNGWKIKDTLTVKTNAELEPFKPYLSEGTKITVLSDETNNGQLTEYISGTKKIVTDGVEETVVDFKKVNNDGVITSNDLALKRLNNHEIGALIYLQGTIYSYTNEESITVYTDKLGDIPEDILAATGYTENPTGFYVLQKIDEEEVLSQMIVKNEINSINIPIEGDDTYDLTQTVNDTGDSTQAGDEANVTQ